MVSLPVDIAFRAKEDQEEVEEGVGGDEGQLSDIPEIEPVGNLKISPYIPHAWKPYGDALNTVLSPYCIEEG